ncbi:TetR/AcrR family transcriptional regulator [Flavobacterium pectinovorum]|uniref:TetR family transcriptional regulator n=1 Tax=Flavobacterium pectinovorum TaxID=29533 RepID=A0AB36NWC4_9FLAO|nr:TetR/AcrR family transcriptional regulator [Flavobacterium pectinovorum]OXB00866.1 TetR family transcriptional regulator [Flavobacterium pectinovorum]WKL49290.1 TetR/AcrR family transcriptional regulator [Flavobacterium pectinovorum]SHN19191.1 transcriptional regulator, TetR family [Flavobacterium pectinovorum]
MSTAERKAREKEALKLLILKGAKKLFLERGIEQTTIRNIADEIDYSVGTVYVYFKDKNAILHDLHSIGFEELGGYFKELFSIKDPMERLKKMGFTYIKFALENTEMYDLMFIVKAPMEFIETSEKEAWNEGVGTFGALKKTVEECMNKGHFKGNSLEPLSFMIWSMVHGMCSLEIRQRTKGVKFSNPDTILFDGYNEYLKIIEKL